MKVRTVVVVLQLETDATLYELRDAGLWHRAVRDGYHGCVFTLGTSVVQAQANVQQPPKAKKRAKRAK